MKAQKKILSLLFFIVTSNVMIFAQDIIITKKSKTITAKVLEVTTNEVKYKDFNNLNGPIYTMLKKDIISISYENGSIDTFKARVSSNHVPSSASKETNDTLFSNVQWSNNRILINNRVASAKEIGDMMQISSPELYKKYSKGKKVNSTGTILLVAGGGALAGGIACLIAADSEYNNDYYYNGALFLTAGAALTLVGTAGVAAGIPLLITGNAKEKKAIRNFGENYLSDEPVKRENQIQLNLNVNKNGVGLAIVF